MTDLDDIVNAAQRVVVASAEHRPELIHAAYLDILRQHQMPGVFGVAYLMAGMIQTLADLDELVNLADHPTMSGFPAEETAALQGFLKARADADPDRAVDLFAKSPHQALMLFYGLAGLAGGLAAATTDALQKSFWEGLGYC